MPVSAQAVEYAEYGDVDVLHLSTREVPDPAAGQVRVRVRAFGVNGIDWKTRRGYLSGGAPLAEPALTGWDLAGEVEAVGPDVTDFGVGDPVVGTVRAGTSAQYVLAETADLTLRPAGVDPLVAAGIGVAGTTAIRVLTLAGVQQGNTVLVHGATGGVGVFVVQLAVSRGATVVGTTSLRNLVYLDSLGATAIAYGDGWVDRAEAAKPAAGYDAVLDLAGAGVLAESINLVKGGGVVLTIADFSGTGGDRVVVSYGGEPGFENALQEAVAAVADGTVVVPIEKTFPFTEVAAAQQLSETGHVRGKIIVTVE